MSLICLFHLKIFGAMIQLGRGLGLRNWVTKYEHTYSMRHP